MSDFASNYAGIDSALDNAFAAIGEASEPATLGEGRQSVLPPNAQSVDWAAQAQLEKDREAADKKAAKGVKDKPDADKPEKPERGRDAQANKRANSKEQQEGLDGAIDKALSKSADAQQKKQDDRKAEAKGEKPKPMSTKDYAASREHRRALKDVFPGHKLSEILTSAEKLESELRRDPSMANMEKLASTLLKLAPSEKAEKKEAQEGRAKSVDRAFEDSSDLDDLKEWADRFGERLPTVLAQIAHWAPQLKEDPFGALSKLAGSLGALDKPEQSQQPAQRMAPPATPQEDYERVSLGVQKAIEQNVLPALANDEVAEQVAFVLERMTRTADRFADLQKAYGIVVGQAAPADPVKDDKGRKSISGGPNMSSGRRPGKGGGSLDDALNRAFGGI